MQNHFEHIDNISKEEFQVLIEYLQKPHQYINARGKNRIKYGQIDFWHSYYQGLKITKPNPVTGQRYFKLADRHGTKIAIRQEHPKDDCKKFIHSARIIEIENHFKLFVNLKRINHSAAKFKLLVNQSGLVILIKKVKISAQYASKSLYLISPEVYISPNFQSHHYDYQIMKLFKDDLLSFKNKHPQLKEAIVDAMIEEVKRIHCLGIIHGDIKPENFCVEQTTTGIKIRLIDFDYCFFNDEPKPLNGYYGTIPYLAPEFFSRLPIFVRSSYQFFNFKTYLHTNLHQNVIACLASQYQRLHFKSKKTQSLGSLIENKIYGFLSLGKNKPYKAVALNLQFIERCLLRLNWREHITQAADIYALGCILKFDLKIPQSSRFFSTMESMLVEEPKHRYHFSSLDSSRTSTL
jgi:serine/threonine protein kinase